MAANNLKTNHIRSISLPSRSHPLVPQFDECLCGVQSSESASVSSSSINHRLDGLMELYDYFDTIFVLSTTHQSLLQDSQNSEMVNELLDGLLRLLDVCTAAKEALSTTKTHIQDLQSAFRRRRGDDYVLSAEIKKYLSHRMKAKKATQKALKNFKLTEAKGFSLMSGSHESSSVVISMLREMESATLAVFESLLYFTLGQRSISKSGSWSLISKLMHTTRVTCEDTSKLNQVEKVDAELQILMNQSAVTCNMFNIAQKRLKELEMSMQDLEDRLECLYRKLIKTRAVLLNVLSC